MPVFRCCWCQTRSEHPQAGVLVVCPECGIKFNAIDWRAKGKDMAHQFNVGDIVLLKGNAQEAEVIGFKAEKGSTCLLLHVKFTESKEKMCFPENSVAFVRPYWRPRVEAIQPPEEDRDIVMTHQFAIADVVKLNHTEQEFVVTGWSQDGKLLHVEFLGNHAAGKIYIPPASVTLVRAGGAAQVNHPSKLET